MARFQKKKNPTTRRPTCRQWIFSSLVAVTCFTLMFVMTTLQPRPPIIAETTGVGMAPRRRHHSQGQPSPSLISTPNNTKITTDVRGNLGPPEVMLTDGTDWLKDRWQAASDMHGTAIQGHHEVLLSFHHPVQINSIVLDWEAAYSKDYIVEGAMQNLIWFTLRDSRQNDNQQQQQLFVLSSHQSYGQSPGVKTKTPLHVVDTLARDNRIPVAPPQLQYLRLTIRSSAMGWGVSLWRVKVYGWNTLLKLPTTTNDNTT